MTARVFVVGDWEAISEYFGVLAVNEDDAPEVLSWPGFMVTDELRSALPGLDDEELEHYAMTEAAQASLGNLRDEGEPMRRLVVVVDAQQVVPGLADSVHPRAVDPAHPGLVTATFLLPDGVESWMVDTEDAADAVRQASAAHRTSDEDAERIAQRCLDHELAWFTAGETDTVLHLR